MAKIPDDYLDLFAKKALAHLATLMPDGSPQVSPVWCDYTGGVVRINTAVGRQKDRNIRRDPRVALSLTDPGEPERFLRIRGVVSRISEEGAEAHINALSLKYNGHPWTPRAGQQRVIYEITPLKVAAG